MTTVSAWLLALSLWVGCLVPGTPRHVLLGLVLLCAGIVLRAPAARLVLLAVGLAVVGSASTAIRTDMAGRAALHALAQRGGEAELAGTVVTEPRRSAGAWWLLVRISAVDGTSVRERAVLRLDGDDLALGDAIALRATARPLGRDGFDAHLRRLHAVAALDPVGPPRVVATAGPLLRATTRVRERTRDVARSRLADDHAAVLTGLLTGDGRDQLPALRDRLAAAGLSHLVVVSGRHVGLVLAGVLGLAAVVGVGARGRRLAALACLAWYVVLVRWQPSVMRAGVMATLVLGAGLLGRRADPRHSLAMAVILLLLADPMMAGHLGFGLSVSATAGVLVLAPWLAERIRGPRAVRTLVAACVGAQVGAAPLLLLLPSGISPASVPANLVAVPAAAAAQAVGLVAAVVGQASVQWGGAVALLATPFLWLIVEVAAWAAAASWPRPATLVVLASAAGVVVASARWRVAQPQRARRRAPRSAVASVAVVVGVALWPAPAVGPVEALTVTALDVGQGDALLVEVPAGAGTARVLIDGGPDEHVAIRELEHRGVRRLDAVVVSHPHHDHTGGLPAVVRELDVGAVIVGPRRLDPELSALSAAEVERVAAKRGVPVHRVAAGDGFRLGEAEVRVLSPPADGRLGDDPNENSVVLHVAGAHGSALLTGDAERLAQEWMLRRPELLRADILKVPHHGGNTSVPGFFAAVAPRAALIGVGEDNDYGHPHPAVLDALAGVTVRRTDRDGTVRVTIAADGVRVAGQKRRRRRPVASGPRGRGGRRGAARHYTRAHAATAHVPPRRTVRAAVAPSGRRPRRGAGDGGRHRGRGSARR